MKMRDEEDVAAEEFGGVHQVRKKGGVIAPGS